MTLRLGFGVSGPLGQWWFEAARTRGLIEGALRGGVAHFDTAPFYFDAEPRLGEALLSFGRNDAFVSTKTGTRRKGRGLIKDFSEAGIRADVDQSRRALGRDALDLLYLHGPTTKEIDACLPTLETLKREGKVARIGVCGEGTPLHHAIGAGFNAIMGVYNIVDRRHERIFAEAKAKGVMTVAIAPLAQGLFDRRMFPPRDLADVWRMARAALRPRYRKKEIAAARAATGASGAAEAALGFVFANPNIDIVMTTTTKLDHLAQSLAVARGAIDPDLLARLRNAALDPPFAGA
jgi:aryl-alcohol dehydrogenase-like predicted oxidoreductase